jgi:hypothetical protein
VKKRRTNTITQRDARWFRDEHAKEREHNRQLLEMIEVFAKDLERDSLTGTLIAKELRSRLDDVKRAAR